jgi:hypothetical protein
MRYQTVAVACLLGGCVQNAAPKPPQVEPPKSMEPLVFADCGERLTFTEGATDSPCEIPEVNGYTRTVVLKRNIITLTLPYGWEAHYAGNGAWLGLEIDSRARMVVYPVKNVSKSFFDEWYVGYLSDNDEIQRGFSFWETGRLKGPFLSLYARSDDKLGVVYARANEPGGRAGVVVHGLWPAAYNHEFLPLALAVGDSVRTVL